MIILFITIICILAIYWFQYPYINNKNNKDSKYKCINFFNHIKIPLFVICIIILILISGSNEKTELIVDLTPVNF